MGWRESIKRAKLELHTLREARSREASLNAGQKNLEKFIRSERFGKGVVHAMNGVAAHVKAPYTIEYNPNADLVALKSEGIRVVAKSNLTKEQVKQGKDADTALDSLQGINPIHALAGTLRDPERFPDSIRGLVAEFVDEAKGLAALKLPWSLRLDVAWGNPLKPKSRRVGGKRIDSSQLPTSTLSLELKTQLNEMGRSSDDPIPGLIAEGMRVGFLGALHEVIEDQFPQSDAHPGARFGTAGAALLRQVGRSLDELGYPLDFSRDNASISLGGRRGGMVDLVLDISEAGRTGKTDREKLLHLLGTKNVRMLDPQLGLFRQVVEGVSRFQRADISARS